MSSGQVLKCGYDYAKTKIVVREMAEEVIRRLVATEMVAEGIVLQIGYDCLRTADGDYSGPTKINHYGETVPKSVRGTAKLGGPTSSPSRILKATMELLEKIMDKQLCSKRIHVTGSGCPRKAHVTTAAQKEVAKTMGNLLGSSIR